MEVLEQSLTLKQVLLSPVLWTIAGAIFYFIGGKMFMNYFARWTVRYHGGDHHMWDEVGWIQASRLLFPASAVFFVLIVTLYHIVVFIGRLAPSDTIENIMRKEQERIFTHKKRSE